MNYSERLNDLIPGGAHTYRRGDDQFPSNAPQILARGKGCYIWDPDGNKYLDYGMALRANTLGYSYEPVDQAAMKEILNGNALPRASMIELKAAEVITDLIPSADMVKFTKNGSTATSAAIKLARAFTEKKYIARCINHPFFSYDDWFIADTPMNGGIPKEISELTLNFVYNNLDSLKILFEKYHNNIACIILQPAVSDPPKDRFLHQAMELCHQNGALFILDEMITGFRWHLNGAESYYDIKPDLSTFGKGMANGFSLAALTGRREIMNLGGIKEIGKERVFLVSTTHGGEMSSLGAFVKTVECYKELNVVDHIWNYGRKMINGMNDIARDLDLEKFFIVKGYPCSPEYCTFDKSGKISLDFRTLFSQEMITNGVLIPWIALSYAHKELELELTLEATKKSLQVYKKALTEGVEKYLVGDSVKPVFRKYN